MVNKTLKQSIPDGWTGTRLGVLLDFKNGLNKEKDAFGKGTPIVNYTDVYKKTSLNSTDVKGLVTVSKNELVNNGANQGDVFFTRTSETLEEIGLASVLLEHIDNCVFSGYVLRGRPKTNDVLPKYWAHSLRTPNIRNEIKKKSSMTTRALTSGKSLSAVEYTYPPQKEQGNIIKILDTWDKSIQKLTQTIALKREVKKGLMQKLLTGESRLPGFSGVFVNNRLDDVANIIMGQSPTSDTYNEKEIGLPLIQGNNDIKHRKTIKRIWTSKPTKIAEKGSIVMTVRAPVGLIGRASEKICLGRGVCAMNAVSINENYLYHYLISYEKQWAKYEQGSTFTAVNGKDIRNLEVVYPSSTDEQLAIALVLESADSELRLLTRKLKVLAEQKKYLLNNLVTGQIRTPENL